MGKAYESLSDKEQLVLTEYFKNGWKQGAAYQKIYPDCNHYTAQTQAYRLFKKPHFRDAKKELADELLSEVQDDIKQKIISRLVNRAIFDPADIVNGSGEIQDGVMDDPKKSCCIDQIEPLKDGGVKVKLADPQKALDQLAKWQKLANESVDVNINLVHVPEGHGEL